MEISKIATLAKSFLKKLKGITFDVVVKNQVEIPEVVIPEVKIPDPIDIRKNLDGIIDTILSQTKELKPSPDVSATKKDILTILNEIKIELSKPFEDNAESFLNSMESLGESLGEISSKIKETDLNPIQKQIEILSDILNFDKFTRYNELRVHINAKQIETLTEVMSTSMVASGVGVIKDGDGNPFSSGNRLPVDVELSSGDIQIGAVELKDGDTDTRADIESDGTKNALFVQANNDSLGVQQVQSNSSNIATETTLGLIKDTDGIKQITDAVTVEQATAASLKALVNPNFLVFNATTTISALGTTAAIIFDASSESTPDNQLATFIIISNCGDDEIYIYNTSSAGPTVFFKRIASGESWEFPLGYTSGTANDLYAERASGTGDVIVTTYKDN